MQFRKLGAAEEAKEVEQLEQLLARFYESCEAAQVERDEAGQEKGVAK